MGTKANPGRYDCYRKAADDEPIFTLRAKDPSAPYLVGIWAAVRGGRLQDVMRNVGAMIHDQEVQALVAPQGYEKLDEALDCAREMDAYRKERFPYEPGEGLQAGVAGDPEADAVPSH